MLLDNFMSDTDSFVIAVEPISKLEHAHNMVEHLFDKYREDPYMLSKTHNYITFQLPHILNNMKKEHEERIQRMEDLTVEQYSFIESFMVSNHYFYVASTEQFFIYDGLNYRVQNEDDIIHHVLSSISKDRQLLCWKQRTKNYAMKKIKENNLLKSVPESETIQMVLDALYPSLFATKAEAKYFLCILGDSIFKKNTDLVHFMDAKSKNFIRELNVLCQLLIGCNLSNTIRHKYHEHDYSMCRFLKINNVVQSENTWMPIKTYMALDLICVACHYSIRYKSSDEFVLNSSNEPSLVDSVFYLKNTTPDALVNLFISDYLQIKRGQRSSSFGDQVNDVSDNVCIRTPQISWRDMQYLWKQFLDSKQLPAVVFQQTLKPLLTNKMSEFYSESFDSFIGISCKHLPLIQKFLQFWQETIVCEECGQNEYEIGEICFLLKKWCEDRNDVGKNMNDKQILDLLSYFFPDIEIEKDKYIYNIKCALWDKHSDVQMGLEQLKAQLQNKYNESPHPTIPKTIISIYDAYKFYCKFAMNLRNTTEQIVSKSYFEKYVLENMEEYVLELKYISVEWLGS